MGYERQLDRGVAPEREGPGGAHVGAAERRAASQPPEFKLREGQHEVLGVTQRAAERLLLIEQRVEIRERQAAS